MLKISLIICTRNRSSRLKKTLDSIISMACPAPWELVIVDNGSTDDTSSVIHQFQRRFHHKLVAVMEPRPGMGHVRNTGWTNAGGDIVAFTDDDCYPAESFLVSVTQCFEENERIGFVGGRVLLYDPTDYRITIQEQTKSQLLEPRSFVPAGFIHGANLSFRRDALAAVGGFDGRLGYGTSFVCEDVEIQARILAHGWHGAFDPRPVIYHDHGRKTEADVNQLTKIYDHGRGAYYVKCLLNKKIRSTYLKNWLKLIRRQAFRTTFRELCAGAEFLFLTVFKLI
jgi:glycosyltransferase involved in cell wall biosynthesis